MTNLISTCALSHYYHIINHIYACVVLCVNVLREAI